MKNEKIGSISRREFARAAAAGSFMIMNARTVRGSQANSALRMGVLGCGGRGGALAGGFLENTGSRVHALGDLFADQIEKFKTRFDELQVAQGGAPIDAKRVFVGPDAYRQLVATDEVDFVLITSPPYFHPQHLEAAVAAGKHVYCEKPVAIDVPGAKRVIKIGEKAQGKVSLDVGFQIRNAPPFVELTRRIHQGALGKIACAQAYYYAEALERPAWPGASPAELRLRNWVYDRVLSGDIIVEQNIHVIDVCNWVLKGHPVKAAGGGGRQVVQNHGDAYDHFNITFTYPGDVEVAFSSTQFNKGWWDVCERFFGDKGVSEAHYSQPVAIYGDEPWDYFRELVAGEGDPGEFSAAGSFGGALEHADSEKQKAYVESIRSGQFHNQAALGAESALSAMLGRLAAYSGGVVTWDELWRSNERWDAGLNLDKLVRRS